MSLLEPALRRVIATGKTEFRPYDRFGKVVPGMTWLPLSRESEDGGPGCFLIRFEPGGASRPHEHVETEEFLLLEGRLEDCDGRVFEAGDFVSYEAGSRHFSVSPEGCLIFVILRAPNRPLKTA